MSRAITIQSNFTTGEIDPLLKSRIDINQYYNALEQARNVLIQPQGGAERRPGLQFINEIPSGASPGDGFKLVPFEYSTTQSYMLLFTNNRMYIYKDKELVTNINGSGNDYLTTTIAAARLTNMDFAQSADTLIVVEEDMAPKQIVRGASHSSWTITDITFDHTPKYAFTISTTSGTSTLTPSAVDGNITLTTGSAFFTTGSSQVGQYVEANDGLGRARITNVTSTTVVEAIVEIPFFNTNAIASGSWFLETGYEDTWSSSKGYPRSVTFHEGRLYFGGSKSRPNTIFASRVARFFDFNPGEGLDDDAIEATIATDSTNAITALFSGRDLQIFTKGAEYFLPQSTLDPITPSNVVINGATRRGSKEGIKPVGAESGTLFIQRAGKALREFLFSDVELSYISNNISLLSSHLLKSPKSMALRKATSTTDGDLLLLVNDTDGSLVTYSILRGQNVIAPSLHTTDGTFEGVAVDVDQMYVVVKRTINSATKYYVEVFNDDNTTDSATLLSGSTLTNASTITKTVTVQNVSGNKYFIDGTQQATLDLYEGHTYKFDQSDSSNSGHPLRFYLDANKTTAYTTGVTTNGTPGSSGAYTQIVVASGAPTLHYQCSAHAAMGSIANTPVGAEITGLSHLEGKTLKIIIDDSMHSDVAVSSGKLVVTTLPTSYIELGLNYTPTIKTMPVELKLSSGNIMAQRKRIIEATTNLYLSQNLTLNGNDFLFTAGNFFTGKKRRKPMLGYDKEGQMTFSQSQPLFFTLLGVEFKVSVGQ